MVYCLSANSSFYDNLKWFGDVAQNCSTGYEGHIAVVSSVSNESNYALAYIADFIQGTVRSLLCPTMAHLTMSRLCIQY